MLCKLALLNHRINYGFDDFFRLVGGCVFLRGFVRGGFIDRRFGGGGNPSYNFIRNKDCTVFDNVFPFFDGTDIVLRNVTDVLSADIHA